MEEINIDLNHFIIDILWLLIRDFFFLLIGKRSFVFGQNLINLLIFPIEMDEVHSYDERSNRRCNLRWYNSTIFRILDAEGAVAPPGFRQKNGRCLLLKRWWKQSSVEGGLFHPSHFEIIAEEFKICVSEQVQTLRTLNIVYCLLVIAK